jgi:AraC-like DNA-binding protein
MSLARTTYREHLPRPELRGHVRVIWELSGACDDPAPQRMIPDGAMSLWLNFGAPLAWAPEAGHDVPPGGALLVGELRRPFALASSGALDLVGVSFRPGRAAAFVAAPLRELVDRLVAAPPLAGALPRERTVAAAEPLDRVGLLQDALVRALARGEPRPPRGSVQRALELLERDAGAPRIAALAATLGLTPRQLERRFADEVGVSPKAFSSVLRFRRALAAMTVRGPDFSEIALGCGYVDQSHMIRDFTRFAGAPPTRFVADEAPRLRAEWLAPARRAG